MARVILVGTEAALVEGLARTPPGFQHEVSFAATVGEGASTLKGDLPAIALVSSEALELAGLGATLMLTPRGALIVYEQSPAERPFLPRTCSGKRSHILFSRWKVKDSSRSCIRLTTGRGRRAVPAAPIR